jgi:hypothetical protein
MSVKNIALAVLIIVGIVVALLVFDQATRSPPQPTGPSPEETLRRLGEEREQRVLQMIKEAGEEADRRERANKRVDPYGVY